MVARETTEVAEPEVRWLTDAEQQAWLAVAGMIFRLPGALDAQLQRDSGMGLFEYLVVSGLSMAENRTMRMSQLAEYANGSLSRLSNAVKRLEQRQWVRREPDPVDGRYTVAILTEAGWDQVVAAAPGHVEAVRNYVLAPLSGEQLEQLTAIGQLIDERVRRGPQSDCAPPDC